VSKLEPNIEWQKKTVAFKIVIHTSSKDDIMKPELWPAKVDDRDRFFKPTPPKSVTAI